MSRQLRLSNTQKKKIGEYVDRALQAYGGRRFDMCEQLCKQIESMQPDNPDLAFLRGAMLLSMSGVQQALPYMQEAAELAPKRTDFQINLGNLYLQVMQYRLALDCFKRVVDMDQKSVQALLGCCQALTGMVHFAEARRYLERALKLKIRKPQEFINMATACRELGEMDLAMATLDELMKQYPNSAQGAYTKALTAMQMGNAELSKDALELTIKLNPTHAQALKMMAESIRFDSQDDARVALIRNALAVCPEGSEDKVYLLNAMGQVEHKLGNYPEAFGYYKQGNDLRASLRDYDAAAAIHAMEGIGKAYSQEVLSCSGGAADATPIFVVGMPRCGSTLVEQILIAHSQVSGRGEIDAFSGLLNEMFAAGEDADVAGLTALSAEQWADVGREYTARVRAAGADTPRIVDKSLNNILFIGALHCALPDARIVHVRRNPLDVCLSIYTSNIQGSLYDYGLRLESLGNYCRKYLELMSHWRKTLPAGVMYELEYEHLVSDQARETRKLLDACNLSWEDACLDFQQARQRVNTASIMQVRQPMYEKSVARWKRYEKQLQPLIDILGTDYSPPS
ncbi:MAG: hypothetical protein COS82_04860 [Zetaproteobacteria bacterium CG06_land_8_20_14_3_00_59_53]|nr:MAG: hypothetical protein AUK36_07910 [Zetaproteobacteria bacterium CG2_30_59_37]PIO88945.1 MAG: hypothetical protein COX56_10965 [Zetaproteobacteria bacterium CG23_combo_of_CG06-09_8_20_14_all_59_86]PIQ65248.1 MAG: hypothetical protein COV97_05545 [Zetaproteobacteria bacterium CG11_big_fil_rev_8_21_14_0_20_59_439]PIU70826.1 MAG: hypothetical protein COS82_04860 [Zetaproteobacteria bacterium CG06_land_8_20_14_3_00_59_53]PIU96498.1 MAG: hypothetical protein COS62_09195 [Zetaproteobacteria bac